MTTTQATTNSAPEPSAANTPAGSRRWVKYAVLIVVVTVIGGPAFLIYRVNHVFDVRNNQQLADSAAMVLPQNFKPAAIYLARLVQSDPSFWTSDGPNDPPDWLPPELGSLHQHELAISRAGASSNWGGGGDDDLGPCGFNLQPDTQANTDSSAAYILSYGSPASLDGKYPARGGEYHFSIVKTDHIGEEEFVKRGLAEIAREESVFATGTEANLYSNNPVYMRQRLLSQHPAVATQLGYPVPATNPTTTPHQ
jgi:hypothetical protein